MQRHWFLKLLAFVVAIVSGAALTLGGLGLLLTGELAGYDRLYDSAIYARLDGTLSHEAYQLAELTQFSESGLSRENYNRFFGHVAEDYQPEFYFHYEIRDSSGNPVVSTLVEGLEYMYYYENEFSMPRGSVVLMPQQSYYPPYGEEYTPDEPEEPIPGTTAEDPYEPTSVSVPVESTPVALPGATTPTEAVIPQTTEPPAVEEQPVIPANSEPVVDYDYYLVPQGRPTSLEDIDPTDSGTRYYHWLDAAEVNGGTVYRIEYYEPRFCTVRIQLTERQFDTFRANHISDDTLGSFIQAHQPLYAPMAAWGAAGLLLSVLWLCLMAGKKPGRDETKPDGLNRIPLDLYLAAAGFAVVATVAVCGEWMHSMVYHSAYGYYTEDLELWLDILLHALLGGGCGLVLAMFAMACAAQMKVGDNYWAKNTLIGWAIRLVKLVGLESLKGGWKLVKGGCTAVGRFFGRCGRALTRLYRMLPLVWQWLLASGVMWLAMFLGFLFASEACNPWPLILVVMLTIPVVLYGAYCFGKLRSSAKEMAGGHLESKISDQLMLGCFRDFADDLNALGDTCVDAAKRRMKSERMKSELITNVSHDIKTPLTSIINYVDLLQKAETEEQKKEYLEVLDRQSQRLKKLIEDLMEMSKASSGNVAAEILPTDVGEAVNQALGEYADQLERCGLSVVTGLPKEPLMALCDGKLLWRVLNNVLSNTVKYAMPGTRVYVDAAQRDGHVELSVKNISAKMLNITADELMERFVRGDESRNTEGNGLGLNIAKSLMEVQGGTLALMVDGDLFKVVLTLRSAA